MKTRLEQMKNEALELINSASTAETLDAARVKYLGKKGELTTILKQMGKLSAEQRPIIGQYANELREALESALTRKGTEIKDRLLSSRLKNEVIDVTLPGKSYPLGRKHPMSIVLDEVKDIFIGMGFSIAEGPEVELVYYNFTALNHPEGHPARDIQDTFYITPDVVLRTQTSPVQIRTMEKTKPPIRIISPGRVYRKDELDATHSPMFHQIEGLVVDRGITMSDLKGTLEVLVKKLYGKDAQIRFRPHHFPFTEPSAEVDIMCFSCQGAGCRMCKGEGWIELLGCGIVHPKVLSICGVDPEEYSGYAFGLGLERMTMRRFNISDLRLFFENDIRFLEQF